MENFLIKAFDALQRELELFHASDLVFGCPVAKFKGYSVTYYVYLSYSSNGVCMLGFSAHLSISSCRMFCGTDIDSAMRAAREYYESEKIF